MWPLSAVGSPAPSGREHAPAPPPTLGSKGPLLNRTVVDEITNIIAGRRPIADFDQVIKEWRDNGGEQIRNELQNAATGAGAC